MHVEKLIFIVAHVLFVRGTLGFSVLCFWLFFAMCIGFCAKKLIRFLNFGVHWGLQTFLVLALGFRFLSKILAGFRIWYPKQYTMKNEELSIIGGKWVPAVFMFFSDLLVWPYVKISGITNWLYLSSTFNAKWNKNLPDMWGRKNCVASAKSIFLCGYRSTSEIPLDSYTELI